ncbi:MAG: AI-2E family transporter [Anaerolineae bacterium]
MTSASAFSPAMRIVLLLAGASVALWGMSQYASYILSLSFAFLIALAADPLVNWLRRKGAGRGVILAISLVVVYVVLALLALLLIYAGAQFLKELPAYTQQAQQMVAQWQATLQGLGLASAGSAAVAGQADLSKPLNWIADLLAALGSAIGSFTTLILLTTFLFVDIVLWPGRLEETARRGHGYARRLSEFTVDLRQYIVVMVIVGTCIGALNTAMFYLFGVPYAALWGVLSGILNFIPFIGFWLGLIPPVILTLLEFGPQRSVGIGDPVRGHQRLRAERDPAAPGGDAAQPDALHEPGVGHLLAAGAGTGRRHRRRAADHGRALVDPGRGPDHALAGRPDQQQAARPAGAV